MVDSRNCMGFISPRPLKRCTLTVPLIFSAAMRSSRPDFSESSQGVEHFLAHVDTVQRRHGYVHVAGADQGCGSVSGTGRRARWRYAGRPNRHRPGCRCGRSASGDRSPEPGSTPRATEMSWTSFEDSTCPGSTSQVLSILPRNGMDRPGIPGPGACLAEPPAESPSTRNNSLYSGDWLAQSASLPGSAGPLVIFLRTTVLLALRRLWACMTASSAIRSPVSTCWCKPLAEGVAHHARDECRALPRGQPLLGLAHELGIVHLYREQVGRSGPRRLPRSAWTPRGKQVA